MPELNEHNDVQLNKVKDTRDILISYALLLPTILGIVKASSSGTILHYRDQVVNFLNNALDDGSFSGQKVLVNIASKSADITGPENVATRIMESPAAAITKSPSASEHARRIAHNDLERMQAQKTSELQSVITGKLEAAKKAQKKLLGAIEYMTSDPAELRYVQNPLYMPTKLIGRGPEDRMHLMALVEAFEAAPGGTRLNRGGVSVDELRNMLRYNTSRLEEIVDPVILDRYTKIMNTKALQIRSGKAVEMYLRPNRSTQRTAADYMSLQAGKTLLINGRPNIKTSKNSASVIKHELETAGVEGLLDSRTKDAVQKQLDRAITGHQEALGVNHLGALYGNYYSTKAQGNEINNVYQRIASKIRHLSGQDGVFKNASTRLVSDEGRAFGNMPVKYFKIMIDIPNGSPIEIPIPTTQLGYTFIEPGKGPMNSRLDATAYTLSGMKGPLSSLNQKIPFLVNKALNDYNENMSGTKASEVVLREIHDLISAQSPATITRGDIMKQNIIGHTGAKLMAGLSNATDYKRAFEASSVINSWRNATHLSGVRIFSFDTEYMRPGGMIKSEGSKLAVQEDTRIWQLGFDILDGNKHKAMDNTGSGTLYIRPSNWEAIEPDVRTFLMRNITGKTESREVLVEEILDKVRKSKTTLVDALKILEKRLVIDGVPTLIAGQNHTEADIPALINTIEKELSPVEARNWKKRLGPLLNADLTSPNSRHIDVMKWWRGMTLGMKTSDANSSIFEQLYKGVTEDEFSRLLEGSKLKTGGFETQKGKVLKSIMDIFKESREYSAKSNADNKIIRNTWKAYQTFIDAGFSGSISYTAHLDARYDSVITALNLFELDNLDRNPTLEHNQAMVRMEYSSKLYRTKQSGAGKPWDYVHKVYDNPEFAYMMREPLYELGDLSTFDPLSGQLKADDYYKADVFSVTHRQASLARAGLFQLERHLPGGFLNNVLRTKFQVYNTATLTINPAQIYDYHKLSKAAPTMAPITTQSTYTTVVGSKTDSALAATREFIHVPSAWQKDSITADGIRLPTLFLPDHLGIVNEGKQYIKDSVAKSILVHKYGATSSTQITTIHLPSADYLGPLSEYGKIDSKNASTIADLLRDLGFGSKFTKPFEGKPLFTKAGQLISDPVRGALYGKSISIAPQERIFGNIDPSRNPLDGKIPHSNNDQLYRKQVSGDIVNVTFNPKDQTMNLEIASPSPLTAGAKIIGGDTMVTKGMLHSKIPSSAVGLNNILSIQGYKFGGSRDELGSLLEVQINRVVDRVYAQHEDIPSQKAAMKKALKPLLGSNILTGDELPGNSPAYPTARLVEVSTIGGGRKAVAVQLTDKGQTALYEKASDSMDKPLREMLEIAGVDYDHTRKQFTKQAQEFIGNQNEIDRQWGLAMSEGIRFYDEDINKLESKLKMGGYTAEEENLMRLKLGNFIAHKKVITDGMNGTKIHGGMIFDPSTFELDPSKTGQASAGIGAITTFQSIRAGIMHRVAETAPYDFSTAFVRQESRFGIPRGPSKTSAYNAMVLRHTIRALDAPDFTGGTEKWIRSLELEMGGLKTSIHSPAKSLIGEHMRGLSVSRFKMLYGSTKALPKVLADTLVQTLNSDAIKEIADTLNTDISDSSAEFIRKEFNISLKGGRGGWAKQLDEQLATRQDLHVRRAEIESLARSRKVTILDSNSVRVLTDPTNKATMFEAKLHDFGTYSGRGSTQEKAMTRLLKIAQEVDSRRGSPQGGLANLFDGLTFDIERDVINKLKKVPDSYGSEIEQLLETSKKFRGSGKSRVGSLVLPRLVGVNELFNPGHAVGGQEGKVVSGGMQRRVLETIQHIANLDAAGTEVETILSKLEDDSLEMNTTIREAAVKSLQNYKVAQSAMQNAISSEVMQNIISPSYSLTMHKMFTSWMPISYGKLFGHLGLIPKLSELYQSMDVVTDKTATPNFAMLNSELGMKEGDFTKKTEFTFPSGKKQSIEYDVRKSFYNLLKNTNGRDANKLFSPSGEILFKGLGINQTIIPYSTAKQFLQGEIVDQGRDLSDDAIGWLQGKKPFPMGMNRDPIQIHGFYGVSASYVVPDELWHLTGQAEKGSAIINSFIYIDPLTRDSMYADFDGDIGYLLSLGDKNLKEAATISNKHTAQLIRQEVQRNKMKGLKGGAEFTLEWGGFIMKDAREVLKQLVNLNEGGKVVSYKNTLQDIALSLKDNSSDISPGSLKELMPESLNAAFTGVDYEGIRATRVDDYLTQKLLSGPMGALHKFYTVQILDQNNSAYTQVRNLVDTQEGSAALQSFLSNNKGLKRDFMPDVASFKNYIDDFYKIQSADGVPFSLSGNVTGWSGILTHETSIQKKLNIEQDNRSRATKYLRAWKKFQYGGKSAKEMIPIIDTLTWDKGNSDLSFLRTYYQGNLNNSKPLDDLTQEEFNIHRMEARDVLRKDYVVRQFGSSQGTNDFTWQFIRKASQGDAALMMTLVAGDYNLSSALTHATAPWARNLGLNTRHDIATVVNQLANEGSMFNRTTAVEMLKTQMKSLFGGAYKTMGRSFKAAGIVALGAMALDPNANSLLIGDTLGTGGERYDYPDLSGLFRSRKPQVKNEPAPFIDKLRRAAGLPSATVPQLRKQRSSVPPRPQIRYTGRRRDTYNKLNINQAIKAAERVAIS